MTNRQIGVIGALGGLSLALLKLVESNFFLDNMWSTTSGSAYLTYAVYIFFGVVVAIYFTDRSLSADKIKKSAFIMGLLAPSVLLAVVTQPVGKDETINDSLQGIPKLGALVVGSAHAETLSKACPAGTVRIPQGSCIKAMRITKGQVEPSFTEALKSALGRGAPTKKYTFIVGVTKDALAAEETANILNDTVLNNLLLGSVGARVVIPEGHDMAYVAVGDFLSKSRAVALQWKINGMAIDTLKNSTDSAAKASAELLLKGRLVEGRALLRGAGGHKI